MKYKTIKTVPMTTIGVMNDPEWPIQMVSTVSIVDEELLNKHLGDGWEIIQFTTHHSQEHDVTGIVAIIGKP